MEDRSGELSALAAELGLRDERRREHAARARAACCSWRHTQRKGRLARCCRERLAGCERSTALPLSLSLLTRVCVRARAQAKAIEAMDEAMQRHERLNQVGQGRALVAASNRFLPRTHAIALARGSAARDELVDIPSHAIAVPWFVVSALAPSTALTLLCVAAACRPEGRHSRTARRPCGARARRTAHSARPAAAARLE
jgi:hypothetical protein